MSTLFTVSEAAGILLSGSGLGHRYSNEDAQLAVVKMVAVDDISVVKASGRTYVPYGQLTGLTVIDAFCAALTGGESRG